MPFCWFCHDSARVCKLGRLLRACLDTQACLSFHHYSKYAFYMSQLILSLPNTVPAWQFNQTSCIYRGEDNVMGVELCLRNRDHVVIVMQYFPHEKFQVRGLFLLTAEVCCWHCRVSFWLEMAETQSCFATSLLKKCSQIWSAKCPSNH